ncbi:hypothetical protein Poli38472_006551 [Pythium oligandrum]|uniref:TAZ-type domain-containing protein n=1 Tax=Pythium oligandrum TaxID=41045 RepID=A0A8K1C4T2_PYTOL|nr:hypothetical protein Poli38472_006551 [Pythium oligandrum]|eukprot:TMW56541.1 hypothetical protein Poli38472_006551 [Pythium oligandrum]
MEQPAKSEHSATDNSMESKKEEITDAMVGGEASEASVEKQTHVKEQVKDQVQRDDQVMSEEQAVEFEHEAQVDDDQVMDDPNEGEQHVDFADMTLEELLQRFPTDDTIVHDALADHIHEAIGIEDAVLCRQYHKCQEPSCLEVVKHRKHAESQQCCGDPICQGISRFIDHRRECDRTPCPFCVRIKQRNLLGKRFCLDQIARQQRRALPTANPAKETFLRAQIAACERKKYATTESVEELNALVLEHKLPVFNFPRFSWHVGDVPIKREPSLSDPPRETTSLEPQPVEPPSTEEATDRERAPHVVAEIPSVADPSQYISDLIERKGRDDSTARIQYDQAILLAFRIVDASFCSPVKASQCLLDCKTILLHLQHHVDLAVCHEELCRTVEFHFSHVSKCVNAGQELECEYCLQVSEREYARAVEVMEHDQVEIESKLQSIIQSLTTSLSNDRGAEREHTVMQLEDELQQAEDHKRELLAKLSSSSLKLRKVRRRLRHHPSSPPSCLLSGLPLHFVKHSHHHPHRNDTKH